MRRDSVKPLTVRFPPGLLDRLTRQTGVEREQERRSEMKMGFVYAMRFKAYEPWDTNFDGHGPYVFAGVFPDMESAKAHFNSAGHSPQNIKLFRANQVPVSIRREAQRLADLD